jgi:ABC-type sugar transport system permease subunit
MLAPYVIGLALLVLAPLLITFALAFTQYDLFSPPRWYWIDNFRNFIVDRLFQRALYNSLWFALIAVPIRVTAALLLALLLNRPGRANTATRAALYLPAIVPDVAYALAWLLVLNPGFGPLNLGLRALGLARLALAPNAVYGPRQPDRHVGFPARRGLHPAAGRPPDSVRRPVRIGRAGWRQPLAGLPPPHPAAAGPGPAAPVRARHGPQLPGRLRGRHRRHRHRSVLHHLLLPHYIFDESFGLFKYGYGSAATVVLYGLTAVLIACTTARSSSPAGRMNFRTLLRAAGLALLAVLFVFPLLYMLAYSLRPPGCPRRGPSSCWRCRLPRKLCQPRPQHAAGAVPVELGEGRGLAVPLTLLTASWAGLGLALLPRRERNILLGLSLALLIVPGPALWVPRFRPVRQPGPDRHPCAAHRPGPAWDQPVLRPAVLPGVRRVPRDLYETAFMDGANLFQVWRRIALPLARPALLAVAVLSFTYYWNDYASPLLYLRSEANFTLPLGVQL